MSNSYWYHFFYYYFGVIRSKINFFSGGKVCLVVASGGHVPLLPPLGPALRLEGLSLPRKSVVRLTDRPDMTLDVYRGRKTTIQRHLYESMADSVCYAPPNFQCH